MWCLCGETCHVYSYNSKDLTNTCAITWCPKWCNALTRTTVFPGMGILHFKDETVANRLIFIMEIPKLIRRHLYIETAPGTCQTRAISAAAMNIRHFKFNKLTFRCSVLRPQISSMIYYVRPWYVHCVFQVSVLCFDPVALVFVLTRVAEHRSQGLIGTTYLTVLLEMIYHFKVTTWIVIFSHWFAEAPLNKTSHDNKRNTQNTLQR